MASPSARSAVFEGAAAAADQTVTSWGQAFERSHADALGYLLSPDMVAVSPLTAAFRFAGVEDGLITEMTLFGRLLVGLTAVLSAIWPELLRRQGKPWTAHLAAAGTAPIDALTRFAERRFMPLANPGRSQESPNRRTRS